MFHTRSGDRVLVDRGDELQVEGTLGGVRPARGHDELLVELVGQTWACTRADGEDWAPDRAGRVRVETLTVPVARPARRRLGRAGARGPSRPTWRVSRDADTRPGKLLTTLEQLPPHVGVVFRGCEARSHERWAGRAHVTDRLLSTSRDPRVATENFSTDAVYAVLSRTGRSIEPFSAARHEREVVCLPGTILTLVTRVRVKDLGVTIVEEFDPSAGQEPPDRLRGRCRSRSAAPSSRRSWPTRSPTPSRGSSPATSRDADRLASPARSPTASRASCSALRAATLSECRTSSARPRSRRARCPG